MTSVSTRLRTVLVVLALPNLSTGFWALFAPRSWYDDFPGRALGWIAAFGDYNEHFIQDIGSAYLGFGAAFLVAAVLLSHTAAQVAAIAYLIFATPHLLIHIFVRETLTTVGYLGTLGFLGIGIALSLWVVVTAKPDIRLGRGVS